LSQVWLFQKTLTSSKNEVKLSRLLLTVNSTKQHFFRVYLQIQLWRGKIHNPLDWGWEKVDKKIIPIFTKEPPAIDSLISDISCTCTKSCEKNCGCKKAGK